MITRWLLPALLGGAFAALAVPACGDPNTPASCGEIPDGGCPDDFDADDCADPTCAAVYTCASGGWVERKTCPLSPVEAGPGVVEAAVESSTNDVAIDAPPGAFGGPGCTDLEMPDCAVGTALACSASIDCCGCQDLYVCVNGGWTPWGECTDAGVVATGK